MNTDKWYVRKCYDPRGERLPWYEVYSYWGPNGQVTVRGSYATLEDAEVAVMLNGIETGAS